jgi:1-deoxy-D-xylulose-5-phosphate synthase
MIADAANHPLVVTVEDGVRQGGAGTAVADAVAAVVAAAAEGRPSPPVLVLGVPDRYIPQASPASILEAIGLDGPGIAASVIGALEAAQAVPDRS